MTGRRYSGINILLLWGAVIERGHASQGWLTFAQALDAGGCVRKGERGVTVVYANRFTPEQERERARSEGDDPRTISFLKRFTLFNIDQCDGLPERLAVAAPPLPERETMPVAEALIEATGADFRIGGAKAFYAPGADYVQVPPQPAFRRQIDYYRTALHELGHWTGHHSRLGRDQSHAFGSPDYALSTGLSGALVWQSLQSRVVPYVVAVDRLGEPRAISEAEASYRPTDPQIAWALGHFIGNVRSVSLDPVLTRASWLEAYDFATGHGAQFLGDYARSADPFANIGERTVSVQVTSVVRASDRSFQVKWTETAYERGSQAGTSHWTAIVTVIVKPPTSAETLRKNPLGLYVDAIDWTRELEPTPTTATAPPSPPESTPAPAEQPASATNAVPIPNPDAAPVSNQEAQ